MSLHGDSWRWGLAEYDTPYQSSMSIIERGRGPTRTKPFGFSRALAPDPNNTEWALAANGVEADE